MKRVSFVLLVVLLLISVGLNVALFNETYSEKPGQGEVKGAYELFLTDLRGLQLGLHDMQTKTDSKQRQLALYTAFSSCYRMHYELLDANSRAATVYDLDLSPLQEYTQGYVLAVNQLYTKSVEVADVSVPTKQLSDQIDALVEVLEGTNLEDKESAHQAVNKVREEFVPVHKPLY